MAGKMILMVEGIDDEHVIKHICGNRGGPRLEVVQHGGIDPLQEKLPIRLKESEVQALGIVVDADTDVSARWDAIRGRLAQAGYTNVPVQPASTGTILEPPADTLLPRVGVWIMPDNKATGILEDFLRFLVPEGSPLFAHVESSVAAIPEGEKRFTELALPKAIIHTWLAWQEEPGKPLGTSITARYLDPTVPQVDVLVAWLNRLFTP